VTYQIASNHCYVGLENGRQVALNCVAFDCVTGFNGGSDTGRAIYCFADTCSTTGFARCAAYGSVAKSCGVGFTGSNATCIENCIAYQCATVGFGPGSGGGQTFKNCTADANGTTGFDTTGTMICINCLATNHNGVGDEGFNASATFAGVLINCAGYNNTTNTSGTFWLDQGFVSLTADPYINQAGADFRPNSASGGGASLRSGIVGVYGQTSRGDIGAVQSTQPPHARYMLGM